MRQVLGSKGAVIAGIVAALAFLTAVPALAQQETSVSNGFSLPGVTLPQGTDEVRAADGTSCRSAVGGNGAYVDMGMIGKSSNPSDNSSYFGRVVVPLGKGPKRLDCSKLYELEVERLKLELELAKAGLGRSEDPELTDSTETASVSDAPSEDVDAETVPEEAAVLEEKPVKTKKKKTVVEATAKPAKKKVGKAGWADDGWSDVGLSEN